jgi:hypothetical protein
MASRCFRKELRRVMLAFATRTASFLDVGFRSGCGAFVNFLPISVGAFAARSTGCVFIGPMTGLFLSIGDNSIWSNLFNGHADIEVRGISPPSFVESSAGGVFLPWVGHCAGRIAGDPAPMRYYRSAERAIALSLGLTFALVGWWEIVGQVWRSIEQCAR